MGVKDSGPLSRGLHLLRQALMEGVEQVPGETPVHGVLFVCGSDTPQAETAHPTKGQPPRTRFLSPVHTQQGGPESRGHD